MKNMQKFRFAPSPNGLLHLGHAYSALLNQRLTRDLGGKFIIRMEDIDEARCSSAIEKQMLGDLAWLDIHSDEPVIKQSERFEAYRGALEKLQQMDLVYPAFLSRGEIRKRAEETKARGDVWPVDPDGSPLYPCEERDLSRKEVNQRINEGMPYSLRLNMKRALALTGTKVSWKEYDEGFSTPEKITADPSLWGDVILARKDAPVSYHLCAVVDDAEQLITNIVRGKDLYPATSVHRLLQIALKLPEPRYHHHALVLGKCGKKLSKSEKAVSLSALRQSGLQPSDIWGKSRACLERI